jgi:hypothetical protein
LTVLQICAVALGGKNLASLCRVFCGDFKQFSSGAPDLHMIRASLRCQCCQRILSPEEREGCYRQFDWKETLGDGWNQQHVLSDNDDLLIDGGGGRGIFQEFSEDAVLRHDGPGEGDGPGGHGKGHKKTFFRNRMGKLVARNLTIEEQFRRSRSKELKSSEASLPDGSSPAHQKVVDLLQEEEADAGEREAGEGDDHAEGSQPIDESVDVTPVSRQDPFECLVPDLSLSSPSPLPLPDGELSLHGGHEVIWSFETVFVEVKGPTDRLSDTQQRWIHILNSNGLETVVCQVKEGGKGMGIAGGHHQSTSSDVTTAVMGEGGEVAGE